MPLIRDFAELRADGQRITETMRVADIASLGPPAAIVALQWLYGADAIVLRFAGGVLARVVPGRAWVAALAHSDGNAPDTLTLWRADGRRGATVANVVSIAGRAEGGAFRWFEPARTDRPHVFGVVFERAADRALFQCDVDASTGAVVSAWPTR